jgi:hypothetical protein
LEQFAKIIVPRPRENDFGLLFPHRHKHGRWWQLRNRWIKRRTVNLPLTTWNKNGGQQESVNLKREIIHIKTTRHLSIFVLVIFNCAWVWMTCALYYSCNYKAGWFPVCLSKGELIINTGISIIILFITSYLLTRQTSIWKSFGSGIGLLVIQVLVFAYVLN